MAVIGTHTLKNIKARLFDADPTTAGVDDDLSSYGFFDGKAYIKKFSGANGWTQTDDADRTIYSGAVSGREYGICKGTNFTGGSTFNANIIFAIPVHIPKITWNFITFENSTSGAGTNARIGIYKDNNGIPTDLLFDSGDVSTAASGRKDIALSFDNKWNTIWLALLSSSNRGFINNNTIINIFGNNKLGATNEEKIEAPFAYGALPATFPAFSYTAGNPPFLRMSI